MEAVAVVLIVFGPIAGFLLLLYKAIRKLRPRPVDIGRWQGPARGGDPAGDREPRRPLVPSASGAMHLPLPAGDDDPDQLEGVALPPAAAPPGHRLAG